MGKKEDSRWAYRGEEFMYSVREYFGGSNKIVGFPSIPKRNWNGKFLELLSFDEFISGIE